jgi:hypothetical protein
MHIARNQTLGDTCPTPLAVAAKQMVWHRATSGKTGVRGGERIWAGSQLNINFCRAAGARKEGRWEVVVQRSCVPSIALFGRKELI